MMPRTVLVMEGALSALQSRITRTKYPSPVYGGGVARANLRILLLSLVWLGLLACAARPQDNPPLPDPSHRGLPGARQDRHGKAKAAMRHVNLVGDPVQPGALCAAGGVAARQYEPAALSFRHSLFLCRRRRLVGLVSAITRRGWPTRKIPAGLHLCRPFHPASAIALRSAEPHAGVRAAIAETGASAASTAYRAKRTWQRILCSMPRLADAVVLSHPAHGTNA